MARMTGGTYPVPHPGTDDPRFTFGLGIDVADVLVRHGYPPPDEAAQLRLMQTLFQFIYREQGDRR